MMKENEQVPDIERLEHHDFDLDVEEQTRLQEEGDREVARVSHMGQYPLPIFAVPMCIVVAVY